MALRPQIPSPVPSGSPDNVPEEDPGENRVWAYNYESKQFESVKASYSGLTAYPYVERVAGTGPSVAPPASAIGEEPPPGFEWVAGGGQYPVLRPIAEGAQEDETAVETPEEKATTPGPPAEKIDWEAIVKAIEVDALQAAQELYGGYYALIEQNEEIKKLILDAYLEEWSPTKFIAKLQETEWWNTTASSARKFDINEKIDPETTKDNINKEALRIQELSMAKGVRLSDEIVLRLARDKLRMDWDEITLANSIGSEIVKLAPTTQVSQGFIGNKIRKDALDFGIRLSDATFGKWTEQILTGKASDQMYKDYLLNQARTLYPSLSNGFDRGLTFKQMTDPYAEQASRILEIPANQIDFTDAKWAAAFDSTDDKGNQRQMTYGEWDRYLKTNPAFGFEYTDQARNQALDLVGRIGRLFGAA